MLREWWGGSWRRQYGAVIVALAVIVTIPAIVFGPRMMTDDEADQARAPRVGSVAESVRSWLRTRASEMLGPDGPATWDRPAFDRPPCDPITLSGIVSQENREATSLACAQMKKIQADYVPECPLPDGCEVSYQARAEIEGVLHLLASMGGDEEPPPPPDAAAP